MLIGALIEGYEEVMRLRSKDLDKPPKEDSFLIKFLKCFSFNSNGKRVLNTEVKGNDHLGCLNGMR